MLEKRRTCFNETRAGSDKPLPQRDRQLDVDERVKAAARQPAGAVDTPRKQLRPIKDLAENAFMAFESDLWAFEMLLEPTGSGGGRLFMQIAPGEAHGQIAPGGGLSLSLNSLLQGRDFNLVSLSDSELSPSFSGGSPTGVWVSGRDDSPQPRKMARCCGRPTP